MLTMSAPRETSLPSRKGRCPGALAPMPAKDGLLVRLRVSGAVLSSVALRRLASAGAGFGNGIFELTSRGNLQMRGVRDADLPSLTEVLSGLGLIDDDAGAEAIRNVLVSPLTGLDSGVDVGPIGKALEDALAQDKALRALPAKFGFLVDNGGPLSLAQESADVRFDFCADRNMFAVGLAGTAQSAVPLGLCEARDVVEAGFVIARAFLRFGGAMTKPPARMRNLLSACSARMIAETAGLRPDPAPKRARCAEASPIGVIELGEGRLCLGVGAPFGRLSAEMLAAAADAAEIHARGEIRLTPWRALIIPRVAEDRADVLRGLLSRLDFVTERDDPRLAVVACIGASGCDCAAADTQADALYLAPVAKWLGRAGVALHVSGCEKGCARPAAAPYTLVAKAGGYDLIVDGAPSGRAFATELSVTAAAAILAGRGEARLEGQPFLSKLIERKREP
ncbi:precorrin-3B synthase [Methylocapsa palsarum]|uniref:Precorrin-3B synthase n=1 Tax=Methylocapsa palsarum TaxID=1612308 RepID=A0A1I4BZZ3_9HYPH|nr:precorrin-3B synthase [Methylocapsa palsarum]SFK73669.1 precorrin-3B synthase [Methylocapsa palsarum]